MIQPVVCHVAYELGKMSEWFGGFGSWAGAIASFYVGWKAYQVGERSLKQAQESHELAKRITDIEQARYVREDMDRQKNMAHEALNVASAEKLDSVAADLISRGFLRSIVRLVYAQVQQSKIQGYNEANLRKDFAIVDAIAEGLKAIDKS